VVHEAAAAVESVLHGKQMGESTDIVGEPREAGGPRRVAATLELARVMVCVSAQRGHRQRALPNIDSCTFCA
jgi:hypothetical protein